jgi:hypothetical protein
MIAPLSFTYNAFKQGNEDKLPQEVSRRLIENARWHNPIRRQSPPLKCKVAAGSFGVLPTNKQKSHLL